MKQKTGITLLLIFLFAGIIKGSDELQKNNTALLIIDIQMFYFPGGQLPLANPGEAAQNASDILTTFREQNMTVIHVRHKASNGFEIHELVSPKEGEKVITKTKANSFIGTDLEDYLNQNNIKNIIITGMQTHMCIEAATRAASDIGYNCVIAEDACTTRDLIYGKHTISAHDVHYSTLNTLNRTYAKIMSTEEVISLINSLKD